MQGCGFEVYNVMRGFDRGCYYLALVATESGINFDFASTCSSEGSFPELRNARTTLGLGLVVEALGV